MTNKKCKDHVNREFFKCFNIDGMNFIRVNYDGNNLKFLCDTGASISCFFGEYLNSNDKIDQNKQIEINGISGSILSMGSANVGIKISNELIFHNFQIVKKFNNRIHGILGSDFFRNYSAVIDYEKFLFWFCNMDKRIEVPLESENDLFTLVPSRCEIIKHFPIGCQGDYVILSQEISEGVFVAGAVVRANECCEIPVRILNANERDVMIRNFRPSVDNASEYCLHTFDTRDITVDRVDKIMSLIDTKSLNSEEKLSIEKICAKYADVFRLDGDPLTVTNILQQKIHLKEYSTPVYVKPYRLPHAQKEEIHKQVDEMLRQGIIEEAQSEWSSPLLIVPKKPDQNGNKKYRVVIDYRLLNKQLVDIKFPLGNISEILDSLAGAIYFTHLDLSQGYYQLELHPDSRPCTAFTTDRGQYQMKRLAMGMKISPSAFSRLMTIAMAGLNYISCFIYLDDLIIFGNSLQNHNQNLMKVLQRLRKVNLKLNPSKCEFLKKSILYLGHYISSEGIAPDPQKTSVLKNYPVPTNSDEVKRFTSFANYYRKFVKNFAEIAQPLNSLSKRGKVFLWTEECQNSFETLKNSLINPPILQYPDFSKNNEFILRTDASGYSLGAVLSNSDDRPVAYASRVLNKAETNYCTIEKELLALVWATKHFRPYLYCRKFKILTDHRPLVYLFNMTNPSSRLTKFRLALEEYDFVVEYVRGVENVTADALSRIRIDLNELKTMNGRESVNVVTRAQSEALKENNVKQLNHNSRIDHPVVVELLKKPKEAIELRPISDKEEFTEILNKGYPSRSKRYQFTYFNEDLQVIFIYVNQSTQSMSNLGVSLRELEEICLKNNIPELFILKNENSKEFLLRIKTVKEFLISSKIRISILKNVQVIKSKELRQLILNDFHLLPTSGHAGMNRMYSNIKKYYTWTGLKNDVNKFVRKCDFCQRCKHTNLNKEPLQLTTTATSAFEKIFLDIVGPLPTDVQNHKYVLTIQCELTKFVEAYPLADKETETVSKSFVESFILRFGIPQVIATDKGTEFLSNLFGDVCKILGITKLNSTAYHHETLGAIENSHKDLGNYLRIRLLKDAINWSTWLQYWCFSYNTTVHSETKYTPFELVFGKLCILPSNIQGQLEPFYNFDDYPMELKYRLQTACTDARSNLILSKQIRNEKFNQTRSARYYDIGDKVLVQNCSRKNKLEPIFKGPYHVLEDRNPNVLLDLNGKEIEVHKNRLKLYYD